MKGGAGPEGERAGAKRWLLSWSIACAALAVLAIAALQLEQYVRGSRMPLFVACLLSGPAAVLLKDGALTLWHIVQMAQWAAICALGALAIAKGYRELIWVLLGLLVVLWLPFGIFLAWCSLYAGV
jgi:hypothetical protein